MLCFNYWFLSSLDALEKALPQWVGALAWSRFPCFFPELGDTLGSPVLDGLTGASRTAMARWAGNAMHVAAVGSALLWIHTYGRPACSGCPRAFAQSHDFTSLPSPNLSSRAGGTCKQRVASPPRPLELGTPPGLRGPTTCSDLPRSSTSRSALGTSDEFPAGRSRSDGDSLPEVPVFPFGPEVDVSSMNHALEMLTGILLEDQPAGKRNQGLEHKSRPREIFPLPGLSLEALHVAAHELGISDCELFVNWCRLTTIGLNRLAGCAVVEGTVRANGAQAAVLRRICEKVARLCGRLSGTTKRSGDLRIRLLWLRIAIFLTGAGLSILCLISTLGRASFCKTLRSYSLR